MPSDAEINQALDDLVSRNYYSAEYEFRHEAKTHYRELAKGDQEAFRAAFMQRLILKPDLANVVMAGEFEVPECVPTLVQQLERHTQPSQITWTIMQVLACYPDDAGYLAIERFLDSAHEIEVLEFLARMDFRRAMPHLRRALLRDEFLDRCLHIFADRRKAIGLDNLIDELKGMMFRNEAHLRLRFRYCFTVKQEPYNPFEEDEVRRLLLALG